MFEATGSSLLKTSSFLRTQLLHVTSLYKNFCPYQTTSILSCPADRHPFLGHLLVRSAYNTFFSVSMNMIILYRQHDIKFNHLLDFFVTEGKARSFCVPPTGFYIDTISYCFLIEWIEYTYIWISIEHLIISHLSIDQLQFEKFETLPSTFQLILLNG